MSSRVISSIDELRSLVGQAAAGRSEWVTVSQAMIDAFAEVTGDRQWIHLDVERAERESPFKTTIAHGFLTLSLLTQLHADAIRIEAGQKMGINYGLNRVRFVSPVLSNTRVRGASAVKGVDDFEGGVQVTWHIIVERENADKPALIAEWITRIYL